MATKMSGSVLALRGLQRFTPLHSASFRFTDVKSLSTLHKYKVPFKYSGRIPDEDPRHAPITFPLLEKLAKEKGTTAPPKTEFKFLGRAEGPIKNLLKTAVPLVPTWIQTAWGLIPQYGTPSSKPAGQQTTYDPDNDCSGNYMSSKFQPNNNCYAYGCDMATNTFAQPGRATGGTPWSKEFSAKIVLANAIQDGLIDIGTNLSAITKYLQATDGHVVALLFSDPDSSASWPGDYHWVRYDQVQSSWSQKDGGDQITNFDFAGKPITDPSTANWSVNQGPQANNYEYVVTYKFVTFMFVPDSGVKII